MKDSRKRVDVVFRTGNNRSYDAVRHVKIENGIVVIDISDAAIDFIPLEVINLIKVRKI